MGKANTELASYKMMHLTSLMVETIKHRGFALLDIFQPCVTFNYINTYDWVEKRFYKLEEKGHDYTDWQKALEKSFELGDRIPIGIFYKEDQSTYRDSLPHLKDKSLKTYH